MRAFPLQPNNPHFGEVRQEKCYPNRGATIFDAREIIPGMGNNLRTLRKSAGLNQQQAADALGYSKSGYLKIERSERRLSADFIRRAAVVFSVREADVIEDTAISVPLIGFVGANSEASFFDHGQGPFDTVAAPDGASEKTVALEIRGVSLGESFDRWLVFYDDRREGVTDDLIGKLCVIATDKDQVVVKTLRRGRNPNRFDLHANVGPPVYDAVVRWAARVKQMTPR